MCDNTDAEETYNYEIVTGKQFKSRYPDTNFYILTHVSERDCQKKLHNGFNKFFPIQTDDDEVYDRGFYFVEQDKIGMYADDDFKKYIRKVTILDNSKVYIYENEFSTNKFVLGRRMLIKDFPLWNDINFCKTALKHDGNTIQFIKNPSKQLCEMAVNQNGYAIRFIENPDIELCKLAIAQNHCALGDIINPDNELCKLCIQHCGYYIRYSSNQTEELCKFAVKQTGLALKFIKEQTEEICMEAVKQCWRAIQYVLDQTEEICIRAVLKNKNAINYIRNPSKKIIQLTGLGDDEEYNPKVNYVIFTKNEYVILLKNLKN